MRIYLKGFITAGQYLSRCGIAALKPQVKGLETQSLPMLWRQALDIEQMFLLDAPQLLCMACSTPSNLFDAQYPCQVRGQSLSQSGLFGRKKGQRLELWQEHEVCVLQRSSSNTTPLFLLSDYYVERVGALTEWVGKGEQLVLAGGALLSVIPMVEGQSCPN
ncbi:hypothetical protein [Rheinheimera sp. F8]|uniref:hypothetical protein n=1 Tax=Rheinheimera sp. F8 TaxID=1763998 RepID=UPI000744A775|nr:hypothetical protein [Rheinheimera sp. F8]ALZ76690.1 hypothetical protein ATY27_13610 [Rheinheimera sp. F8]